MPNKIKNPGLTSVAQELRKNMTEDEKHLWYDFLVKLPVTFNRQKVIGVYVVDFYCASAKLAIELDGRYHEAEEASVKDAERDAVLNGMGITVMRFRNKEIRNDFRAVCDKIKHFVVPELC